MGSRNRRRQRRTDRYSVRSLLSPSTPKLTHMVNSSTIESLLEAKFQPRRTVVLAFGFDEESSGFQVSLPRFSLSEIYIYIFNATTRVPANLD